MGCVFLHVSIMAPHGNEWPDELKNQIVTLHKNEPLQISEHTTAAVIRRYRTNHSTMDQGLCLKMTPQTEHYFHNLAVKNTRSGVTLGTGLISGNLSFCDNSENVKDSSATFKKGIKPQD